MSGELGFLFEDMKDQRRRGEWTDAPSRQPDAFGEAQREALARLALIFAPETIAHAPLSRLIDVGSLAERVFGDASKANAWLHRPNGSLAAQRPIDLLADDLGTAVVKETLERIDYGVFA